MLQRARGEDSSSPKRTRDGCFSSDTKEPVSDCGSAESCENILLRQAAFAVCCAVSLLDKSDSVWFTDDGGKTYTPSTTLLPKMDEAQLVENTNGTIIANMRHSSSPTTGRAISTSTDGGHSFSKISYDATLVASVCQATMIRSAKNDMIYFANPAMHHGRSHGVRPLPPSLAPSLLSPPPNESGPAIAALAPISAPACRLTERVRRWCGDPRQDFLALGRQR